MLGGGQLAKTESICVLFYFMFIQQIENILDK